MADTYTNSHGNRTITLHHPKAIAHAKRVWTVTSPAALADLGPRAIAAFDLCGECAEQWTWLRYGGKTICRDCALTMWDEWLMREEPIVG